MKTLTLIGCLLMAGIAIADTNTTERVQCAAQTRSGAQFAQIRCGDGEWRPECTKTRVDAYRSARSEAGMKRHGSEQETCQRGEFGALTRFGENHGFLYVYGVDFGPHKRQKIWYNYAAWVIVPT